MTNRKPPLLSGSNSVKNKLDEINEEVTTPSLNTEKEKYKIALDTKTIETLKQKHGLVEDKAKASFYWKKSFHRDLKRLAIDTDKPVEAYLVEWAEEGLRKMKSKFYKEI